MRHVLAFMLAAIMTTAAIVTGGSGTIAAGPRKPPVVRPVVRAAAPRAVRPNVRAAVLPAHHASVRHIAVLHSPAPQLGTMEIGPKTQPSPSIIVAPSPTPTGACAQCPQPTVVQLNVVQVPL